MLALGERVSMYHVPRCPSSGSDAPPFNVFGLSDRGSGNDDEDPSLPIAHSVVLVIFELARQGRRDWMV